MRNLFVLWLIVAGSRAPARSLEEVYAGRIARAHDARSLLETRSSFEELQVARVACRLQLKQDRVPEACYQALKIEVRWGLHPRKDDASRLRNKIDEACRRAAGLLNVPRVPRPLAVSESCATEVTRARAIRAYREERPDWSGI